LLGHLGKDAETRYMQDGTPVTALSVATTRSVKRGENYHDETDWHRVTLWGREGLLSYLTKGTKLLVEGRLAHRKVEKPGEETRYYTDVVASDVILCGSGSGSGERSQPRNAGGGHDGGGHDGGGTEPWDTGFGDDQVPF
jgi:single-strand DNA-binding protein